jgi:hypothetical protein
LSIALLDRTGRERQVWTQLAPAPSAGAGLLRQQIDLVLAPDAAAGKYWLVVRAARSGAVSELGQLCVTRQRARQLAPQDVSIAHPRLVDLDRGVRLLGYDMSPAPAKAGDILTLTLYWQARTAVEQRYKVFTHLLGETFNAQTGSFIWGQQDNEPASDTRPTTTWRVGEVIVDEYAILVDPTAPAGQYSVEIGMYEPATGTRLPVLDGRGDPIADHIVLSSLQVMQQ